MDLLIEDQGKIKAAIEIKHSSHVVKAQIKGLFAFHSEYPDVPCYVIARVQAPYQIENVTVLPWDKLDSVF